MTNYYKFRLYPEKKTSNTPKFHGKTPPHLRDPHLLDLTFSGFVVCAVCAAPDSAACCCFSCCLCSCCGLLLLLLLVLLLVLVSAVWAAECRTLLLLRLQCLAFQNVKNNVFCTIGWNPSPQPIETKFAGI